VPTYEYRCDANDRLVEVRHKMAESIATWGELCARAGISLGGTDPLAPVEKLMSAGFIGKSASSPACEMPSCDSSPCAAGPCGRCDLQEPS